MRTIGIISFLMLLLTSCQKEKSPDAYGNFESMEITVSALSSGQLIYLNVEEGQTLDSGELVGMTDTTALSIQKTQLVAKKEAILVKSKNIAAQADALREQLNAVYVEKDRLQKLFTDKAATPQQLDDINGKIKVLEAQVKSIESQYLLVEKEADAFDRQIDLTDYQLSNCRIINPVRGTVLTKYAEKSEVVQAGKPIYKIADLNNMYLRAYISGAQLSSVKTGMKVRIFIDNGKKKMKEYSGIVSWISSNAEFTPKIIQTKEARVNLVYALKIKVLNDGSIKIGMPGEAFFD